MKKRTCFCLLLFVLVAVQMLLPPVGSAGFSEPLDVQSAIVINAATGEVLFQQNSQQRRYPASTTKMMTALLLAEEGDMQDWVTVSAASGEGLGEDSSSVQPPLETGEILSVGALMRCILIASDNRACNVAAEYLCDSVGDFVGKMNARAAALGCTGTHFANPHGLHQEDHYTTAEDLAKISQEILKNTTLMELCTTVQATLSATNKQPERTLRTTNRLLQQTSPYYYSRAQGLKTGFTTPAGYCLATSAKSDELEVIAVVMGGEQTEDGTITSFRDGRNLLKWALSAYRQRELVRKGEIIAELPVALSSERDYVMVSTGAPLKVVMESEIDQEQMERTVVLDSPEGIDAPVEAGQVLGHMVLSYQGKEYGQVDLVAATAVSFDLRLLVMRKIGQFFSSPIFWIVFVLAAAGLTAYGVHVAKINRERRRSRW